ncbi:MAG TPA: DUF922 domain-containing protein [Chitinophagales bacterium]|jgi:hypothetical protein|nr:DUF922 domain-containing protein [Chitinophagales bacterium]HQV77342.1 DUF922 domain-containing protein [Chitinophagales bacterium]HQW78404.1 DUF922 domain-containing protein [Chitinophagales bacterium]HRB92406.1 DUF922 domain-containing protein [Chitinophagales bacterium]
MTNRFIILCLLVLVSITNSSSLASNKFAKFIVWNENRKLTWNDFNAKPERSYPNMEEAQTVSSIEVGYTSTNKKIEITIAAKFYPNLSWHYSNINSSYILQHEQLHFDITELYARMMRKQISEQVKSSKDKSKYNSIVKKIMNNWDNEQNAYDDQTNHGANKTEQLKWENNIQLRLAELDNYKSK